MELGELLGGPSSLVVAQMGSLACSGSPFDVLAATTVLPLSHEVGLSSCSTQNPSMEHGKLMYGLYPPMVAQNGSPLCFDHPSDVLAVIVLPGHATVVNTEWAGFSGHMLDQIVLSAFSGMLPVSMVMAIKQGFSGSGIVLLAVV